MKKREVIQIKYHDYDLERLEKIKVGDWIDLRAAEDVFIPHLSFKLISLGISMKLPDGYEAHIVPRSSTFKTWGIIQTNSMGVIDNSYSGTNDIWKFPAFCLEVKATKSVYSDGWKSPSLVRSGTWIHKNDRICQFRIVKKQPEIEFDEVMFLDETDRGGFGTTGTN